MADVAVDACCLINLLAADCVLPKPSLQGMRPKDLQRSHELPSLGLTLHVPAAVANESLYILQPDHEDQARLIKSPIDLAPFFAANLLHRCDIEGEDETAYLVSFASRLDDGEAACMALAKSRQWWLWHLQV
jgi:hypothetical protein